MSDEFRYVRADAPVARPLLEDLAREYDARYGDELGSAWEELTRYPPDHFDAPHGAFVVLLREGRPIAGGAFMRFDEQTTEFKRIWTHPAHRGHGLSRRVLAELEQTARDRGYRHVFLTTGPRQPEAIALYLSTGYTPLYDRTLDPEEIGVHAFGKRLVHDGPSPAPLTADDFGWRPVLLADAHAEHRADRPAQRAP